MHTPRPSWPALCMWQHQLNSIAEAQLVVSTRIHWYNRNRPFEPFGYLSPAEDRTQQLRQVARRQRGTAGSGRRPQRQAYVWQYCDYFERSRLSLKP